MIHDYLGTLPQQISAVGIISVVGILLRYRLGWRKQTLGSEADIRDHYAEELAAVRKERAEDKILSAQIERHLRGLAENSDRRHAECEEARAEDRRERSRMQDEIDGMKRQIIRYSAEGVLVLSEQQPSPLIEEAAKRVQKIVDRDVK